jgi:hypothetical protein
MKHFSMLDSPFRRPQFRVKQFLERKKNCHMGDKHFILEEQVLSKEPFCICATFTSKPKEWKQ